jgi:hypothetical protein
MATFTGDRKPSTTTAPLITDAALSLPPNISNYAYGQPQV